ncbi:MAG: hypothetical protein SFU98_21190, partial [Leptospiraceae bacterium]|nr:hypothetical protein [Leptospiraceae bacterium]
IEAFYPHPSGIEILLWLPERACKQNKSQLRREARLQAVGTFAVKPTWHLHSSLKKNCEDEKHD